MAVRAKLEVLLLAAFVRKGILRVVNSVPACVGVLLVFVIPVTLDVPVVKFFRLPRISIALVANTVKS